MNYRSVASSGLIVPEADCHHERKGQRELDHCKGLKQAGTGCLTKLTQRDLVQGTLVRTGVLLHEI
jgi:hypothetical protein